MCVKGNFHLCLNEDKGGKDLSTPSLWKQRLNDLSVTGQLPAVTGGDSREEAEADTSCNKP